MSVVFRQQGLDNRYGTCIMVLIGSNSEAGGGRGEWSYYYQLINMSRCRICTTPLDNSADTCIMMFID